MSNLRYYLPDNQNRIETGQMLYISTSKYEGEWESVSHLHRFGEIFYVTKGKGQFFIEGKKFSITANDLIVVNPNVSHAEVSSEKDPLEYIVLGISDISFSLREGDDIGGNIYKFEKYKNETLFLLNQILIELENKNTGYVNIVNNHFESFLIKMMRNTGNTLSRSSNLEVSKECVKVKRYLDSNYFDNINLDTLAEMVHINKYYLTHTFKKHFGISPINYLISKRLQISKGLLSTSDYSVLQVSNSCGFSSQSYFCQSFKKNVGITPVEYRKTCKNE